MDQNNIIIAIGGNIKSTDGLHPIDVGQKAIKLFEDFFIFVEKKSRWYISDPIPISDQPKYFNSVIVAKTSLNEFETLNILHKIENKLGRIRNKVNESRVIDLDLIAYHDDIIESNVLTLPHPRLFQRAFVVKPILEIAPNWRHPVLGVSIGALLPPLANQKIKQLSY